MLRGPGANHIRMHTRSWIACSNHNFRAEILYIISVPIPIHLIYKPLLPISFTPPHPLPSPIPYLLIHFSSHPLPPLSHPIHLSSPSHPFTSPLHPIHSPLLPIPSIHLSSPSHPFTSPPHPIHSPLLPIPSIHLSSPSHPFTSPPHPIYSPLLPILLRGDDLQAHPHL